MNSDTEQDYGETYDPANPGYGVYDPAHPEFDKDNIPEHGHALLARTRARMYTIDELALADDDYEEKDEAMAKALEDARATLKEKEKKEEKIEAVEGFKSDFKYLLSNFEFAVSEIRKERAKQKEQKKKKGEKFVYVASDNEMRLVSKMGSEIYKVLRVATKDAQNAKNKNKQLEEWYKKQIENAKNMKAVRRTLTKLEAKVKLVAKSAFVRNVKADARPLLRQADRRKKGLHKKRWTGGEVQKYSRFKRMNQKLDEIRRKRRMSNVPTSWEPSRLDIVNDVIKFNYKLGRLVSRKSLIDIPTSDLKIQAAALKLEVDEMKMADELSDNDLVPYTAPEYGTVARRARRARRATTPEKKKAQVPKASLLTDSEKKILNWEPAVVHPLSEIRTALEFQRMKEKGRGGEILRQEIRKKIYSGVYDEEILQAQKDREALLMPRADSPDYGPASTYVPYIPDTPPYMPLSPGGYSDDTPAYVPVSPGGYADDSPAYVPVSPAGIAYMEQNQEEMEELDLGVSAVPPLMSVADLRKRMRERATGKAYAELQNKTSRKKHRRAVEKVAAKQKRKRKDVEYVRAWSCKSTHENKGAPLVPRIYKLGERKTEILGDERVEYVRILPMHRSGRAKFIQMDVFNDEFVERGAYEESMREKFKLLLEESGQSLNEFSFEQALCPKKRRKRKTSPGRGAGASGFSVGDIVEKVKNARSGEQVRITFVDANKGTIGGKFVSDGKTCRKQSSKNFSK